MNSKKTLSLVLLLVPLLGLLFWTIFSDLESKQDSATVKSSRALSQRTGSAQSEIENSILSFRKNSKDSNQQTLADLKAHLFSLPKSEAADAIRAILAQSDVDTETGIEFEIGKDGFLTGHPTLRVALLDWLGSIDQEAAGEVAAQILDSPTHPDEWAIALRNYARSPSKMGDHDFLRQKTEELIKNPAWQANPTVGYLNAFDVLAHTRSTTSTPLLSDFVKKTDRQDLAHASFLTLDRLVQTDPQKVLSQLTSDSILTRTRGPMLANLVARADLRRTDQKQLVRDYLLSPQRTQGELESFAGVFPNDTIFLSNTLLTQPPEPNRQDQSARDEAALLVVQTWLAEPAFQPLSVHLQTMRQRLHSFLNPGTVSQKTAPAQAISE